MIHNQQPKPVVRQESRRFAVEGVATMDLVVTWREVEPGRYAVYLEMDADSDQPTTDILGYGAWMGLKSSGWFGWTEGNAFPVLKRAIREVITTVERERFRGDEREA